MALPHVSGPLDSELPSGGSVQVGQIHGSGFPGQKVGSPLDFPVALLKGCEVRGPFLPSSQLRTLPGTTTCIFALT